MQQGLNRQRETDSCFAQTPLREQERILTLDTCLKQKKHSAKYAQEILSRVNAEYCGGLWVSSKLADVSQPWSA